MSFTRWLVCSRMLKQVELDLDLPFGCFTRISSQTISLLLLVNLLWIWGGGGSFSGGPIWLIGSPGWSIMACWHKTCQIGSSEQQVQFNCNIYCLWSLGYTFGSCIPVFSLQCQLIETLLGSGIILQVN